MCKDGMRLEVRIYLDISIDVPGKRIHAFRGKKLACKCAIHRRLDWRKCLYAGAVPCCFEMD